MKLKLSIFLLLNLFNIFSFYPNTCQSLNEFQVGWWVDNEVYSPSILNDYNAEGNTLVLLTGWVCSTSQIPRIRAFLNVAQIAGIKVIVGLICRDGGTPGLSAADFSLTINSLKDHPALFGWNLGDEPEKYRAGWQATHSYLATIPGYFKVAKTIDPNHPVFISHDYNSRNLSSKFFDVVDVSGIHAYPFWSMHEEFGNKDARHLCDMWKQQFESAKARGKDFIATVQGFGDNSVDPYRNPTINELRYEVFSAVVQGINKVLFWMDSWGNKGNMRPAVNQLISQIQMIGAEMNNGITNDPRISVDQNLISHDKLVYRYGVNGNSHAILAVNIANRNSAGGQTLSNVLFTLPIDLGISKVDVVGESRTIPVFNGVFADSFSKFEVHIYKFSIRGPP